MGKTPRNVKIVIGTLLFHDLDYFLPSFMTSNKVKGLIHNQERLGE